MYKTLLTLRYLRRKLIAAFAVMSVTLCTALLIIEISVMGGFLDLVRNAGHSVVGDVVVSAGLEGFRHYEALAARIETLPEASTVAPVIQTYGLLKIPGRVQDTLRLVQVRGIKGPKQADVTAYRRTLFWRSSPPEKPGAISRTYGLLEDYPLVAKGYGEQNALELGVELTNPWGDDPAMVPGIEISPYYKRTEEGTYKVRGRPSIRMQLILSVLPISEQGGLREGVSGTPEAVTERFTVVNEFHSGLYDVDSRSVFIPFKVAQEMMGMGEAKKIKRREDGSIVRDESGKPVVADTVPARCTELHISAAKGVTPKRLQAAVKTAYNGFRQKHPDMPFTMSIQTWEQRQADFIRAVENEKGVLTGLFAIISVVAVVMIAVIFYMIVLEKTRDIGILRALGASKTGVASIFLGYGAAVGTIGAAAGLALAYLFVTYINEIHAWLGDGFGSSATAGGVTVAGGLLVATISALVGWARGGRGGRWFLCGGVVGAALGLVAALGTFAARPELVDRLDEWLGFVLWNREVYFFSKIPNEVEGQEAAVIVAVAIVASVVGALIPSILAARVDPVRSLRYE